MTTVNTTKPRVLVIDDDHDYLLQQKLELESAGFEVLQSDTTTKAEKLLSETKPSIAIVDMEMEEPDTGYSLCFSIKQRYPDVPVIVVTGVVSDTGLDFDTARIDAHGRVKPDLLLAKPVRIDELASEIHRLLRDQAKK